VRKHNWRKMVSLTLGFALAISLAGCSGGSQKKTSDNPKSEKSAEKKTKVTFWYLWSGEEGETIEKAVQEYNKQSDKYKIDMLSVPDTQKIMAAIPAGNGPDVSDDFSNNVGKYASAGILEPLDDYISKTKYDTDDFIPAALDSCKMDGKTYSLPISMNLEALYYNKTLLKEAGYTEPPKTMEEMYEMAVKTTKVNEDGTLDVCGFPDFPAVYYLGNFATAAGGGWYTEDGKPSTPDDFGNQYALKLARDYRTKFGLENVIKFQSGGKYLDPTDPFLAGKQVFRVDGSWMGKSIKETFQSDVDYGVTYIPYPKDKPELKARGLISTSTLYITANSGNKDGSWDFMAWFAGKDGQAASTIKNGGFPSRTSLLGDETFRKGYDIDFYTELAQSKNLTFVPNGPKNSEYDTIVSEQTELCLNLKQDIETTLKNINTKGSEILK